MSEHNPEPHQQQLGTKLRSLLCQFEGRSLDDSCIAEMAKTLNEELASELEGRHIRLRREHFDIRVEVRSVAEVGEINVGPTAHAGPPEAGLAGFEAVEAALAA